jgi:hypothetical protein
VERMSCRLAWRSRPTSMSTGGGAYLATNDALWFVRADAVRERHHNDAVANELVICPADGSAAPWPVVQGWGFLLLPATESRRARAGLDELAAPADALGRHVAMGGRDPPGRHA